MNYFNLNTNSKIVFYGYSLHRHNLLSDMKSKGYHVIAYFDKRADELNGILEIPVYTIENAPFTKQEKFEMCVFICLQNAIQHDDIANALYKNGYQNIVFLPTNLNIKNHLAHRLRQKYTYLLCNQYDEIKVVPCYSTLFWDDFNINRVILHDYKDNVIVWVPIELIFSYKGNTVFSDVNISRYIYRELFAYLENGKGDIKAYFNYIKEFPGTSLNIIDGIDRKFLLHRMKLYFLFISELNKGIDFFVDSASFAKWNDRGYFNLLDGHHRASFLYYKSLKKIPVLLDKKDFDKWINNEWLKECIKFMKKNKIKKLPAPIAHPAFLYFGEESNGYIYTVLRNIVKIFNQKLLAGKKILDISSYHYFFSQYFKREKVKQIVCVEEIELIYEFTKLINKLLYLEDIQVEKNIIAVKKYQEFDITLMLNRICKIDNDDGKKALLKNIDNCTKEFIIWESGCDVNAEKDFIIKNSSFKYYQLISQQFNGSYISEIGVFKK